MKHTLDTRTLLTLLARKGGLPARWLATTDEKRIHEHRSDGSRKAWMTRKAKNPAK